MSERASERADGGGGDSENGQVTRETPLPLPLSVLPCCSERALFFWPPLISKLEKNRPKGKRRERSHSAELEREREPRLRVRLRQPAGHGACKERKEEEDVDIGQTRGRRAKVQFDDFFCGRPSVRRRRPLPLQSRRTLLPLADIAKVNLLRINSAWRCPEAKVAPCEDGS